MSSTSSSTSKSSPERTYLVLRPDEELTQAGATRLLDGWLALVDEHRPAEVTIDLQQVHVVDRAGLSALHFLGLCLEQRGIACQVTHACNRAG